VWIVIVKIASVNLVKGANAHVRNVIVLSAIVVSNQSTLALG